MDFYLRTFLHDFINMFAPHLTRPLIEQAMWLPDGKEREALFKNSALPVH